MAYVPRTGAMTPNNVMKGEIWSALIQKKWYADSLIREITNNTWENEIKKYGQIVHIRKRPDAMVNPYVINQQIDWQAVTDEKITFTIDYAYYAALKLDSVDVAQMDINLMTELVDELAKRHMNKEDEVFFSVAPTKCDYTYDTTTGGGGAGAGTMSAVSTDATYFLKQLSGLRNYMNRRFVPLTGRKLVVPPEVEDIMLRADFNRWDVMGDRNRPQKEGKFIGQVLGFDVYVSPFITGSGVDATPYNCLALHESGFSFARQVTETHVCIELQDYFGKGVKSLNVFGFEKTGPAGTAILWQAQIA